MHLASSTHPAHNLVEYKKYLVLVAHLADRLEVARDWGQVASSCATDWKATINTGHLFTQLINELNTGHRLTSLGEEGCDLVGSNLDDLGLKLVGQPV